MNAKDTIKKILALADVQVNGDRDWDIQVHDDSVYGRVLSGGHFEFANAYVEGLWDCKKVDVLIDKLVRAQLQKKIVEPSLLFNVLKNAVINRQTKKKSKEVAEEHYDLGNDFYSDMLDSWMQYTCAYWKDLKLDAKNLKKAQEQKLHLICQKLQLKKGEKVLELGCGWGGFAKFAAENYGVEVTSYNISKEQVAYARKNTKGLPVTIVHKDYREATGTFDKVVSIGMMEHVGHKNYPTFMKLVNARLKEGGLCLVHTIGKKTSYLNADKWITTYIFPGGYLPSIKQLVEPAEKYFIVEDYQNIGPHYDPTLMAWHENFVKNWKKHDSRGEKFFRMWSYYLLSCAGGSRSGNFQLFQVVYGKRYSGMYYAPR